MKKKLLDNQKYQTFLVGPDGDPNLREMFERFRYSIYAEKKGWENKNETGLESDDYDAYSHYLLIFQDKDLVAGCRFIDGRSGSLPIGKEVTVFPNSAEISRYLLKKKSSLLTKVRTSCVLHRSIYLAIEELQFDYAYALILEKLFKAFKLLSILDFEQIGEKKQTKAGPSLPVMQNFQKIREAYANLAPIHEN